MTIPDIELLFKIYTALVLPVGLERLIILQLQVLDNGQ